MSTQVTIVGTGLIGGSLAKAIRKSGFADVVVGYDRNEDELKQAKKLGVIDRFSVDVVEAIKGSEIIVLAVPVLVTGQVLDEIKDALGSDSVVTDVGSSKAAVVAAAKKSLGEAFDRFVPGHPIAGREQSGIAAAETELFRDHRIILTPLRQTDPAAITRVTEMWESIGADVKCLGVQQHDLVLGVTSHLPHVLAYATVDTLAGTEYVDKIFDFAAGGFRDFTRIASSDPIMWRDICLTNKDAILNVLGRFEDHLATIRTLIENEDSPGLTKTFANAKQIRDNCLKRKS
jgi:prephenate dehydrogenase